MKLFSTFQKNNYNLMLKTDTSMELQGISIVVPLPGTELLFLKYIHENLWKF